MAVETLSYALSLGAKAVGSQVIKTTVTPRVTMLECRALFQGALGAHSIDQSSQLLTGSGESLRFSETAEIKGEKHTFEVAFDARSGLVKATRQVGAQIERAETPCLRPYRDPLGLLHTLRGLAHGAALTERVPLLGKDVVIESLGEWVLETTNGERPTFGYVLRPGPSYVYLDARPPHAIIRLIQPTQYGQVEASLIRAVEEDGTLSAPKDKESKDRSGKRRRRGGRRRRRVESS